MDKTIVIHDLQFGSTGKGQIAGAVAMKWAPDTAVCAFGPNAGHSFCHPNGRKYVHTMLPISSLISTCENILIGPGAVVNVAALVAEVAFARDLMCGKHLFIHPQASILSPAHVEAERAFVRVGSTMKGTAEAVISKMRRDPEGFATLGQILAGDENSPMYNQILALDDTLEELGVSLHTTEREYDAAVDGSRNMVVEGAQGHSLGIHTSFYPHVTSRDVSVAQLFADCRLPINRGASAPYVIGVCRTFPIRVANRFDSEGAMIGTSGGCYPDQSEIEWSSIGKDPELTTVTKLPRRLFTFSEMQIREAARLAMPNIIALTFCDYLYNGEPDISWPPHSSIRDLILRIERASQSRVRFLQYGPKVSDLYGYEGGSVIKHYNHFLGEV